MFNFLMSSVVMACLMLQVHCIHNHFGKYSVIRFTFLSAYPIKAIHFTYQAIHLHKAQQVSEALLSSSWLMIMSNSRCHLCTQVCEIVGTTFFHLLFFFKFFSCGSKTQAVNNRFFCMLGTSCRNTCKLKAIIIEIFSHPGQQATCDVLCKHSRHKGERITAFQF